MRTRLMLTIATLALIVAACGGSDTSDTTAPSGAAPSTEGSTATTVGDASSTTAGETMDGIHAADNDLGTILVDGEGFTLYIFRNDTDGTSVCNDACADLWPPVAGDAVIDSSLEATMFDTTTRDDGSDQLTVNGMPLYRYTPDAAPGDTSGQGFNGVWFVVDANGGVIEAAADGATPIDYDY